MTVQARLSDTTIVVSPGGEETVRLAIRNLGADVETFAITPSGLGAGWATVDPASLALLPGEEQAVSITLRPPRAAEVSSGDSVLAFRVVPHGRPADVAVVEATVRVLEFANRRLTIAQPVQVGNRRASFDVVLENHGNQRADCRLTMTDMSGQLVGRFHPSTLAADPGQSATARLRVSARRPAWFGANRSTRFSIEAEQGGAPTAIASATYVQSPLVSGRFLRSVAALAVTGAVAVAAWLFVVRPAIDDAAADAVADAVPASAAPTAVTAPPVDGGNDGSTPVTPVTPVAGVLNTLVSVAAAPGKAGDGELAAADDLEVTDLVVQNPAGDQGTLTIGIGDTVLFTFDLETVYGYEQVALTTPVVVPAGDALVVRLRCDAPGDPSAPECTPSVFVSGRGS